MFDKRHRIKRLITRAARESGQTMSEYAITLMVISTATVMAFTGLSGVVANLVTRVAGLLP
jgi:ribonuclease P protein component